MDTLLGKHWHHLHVDEVLELLQSNAHKGLDTFEVQRRQNHFGPNVFTSRGGISPLIRFLLQFKNPLILILLVASGITLAIKDPVDALIILAVVLVNAVVGYMQEYKAEKAIEALAESMTSEASVIRAGGEQTVSAADLVPGDIVVLRAGDKVPADMRLIRARDLQVAEAALTGESVPVFKESAAVIPLEAVLAERATIAYASTLVTSGQGAGVVIATGDRTEVGRISQLISEAQSLETPLTRKIAEFSRLVLYAVLALAAVSFAAGLLRGQPVVDTFTAAIALTVAMIPEGLPPALTVTLAIGVSRMARRRAIIRKLPAVETLGSVTVICTDKTGTLTQNQMTTRHILAGGREFVVSGSGYDPEGGQIMQDGSPVDALDGAPAVRECLIAGLLCNDSGLVQDEGRWDARGDPTEVALIVVARKAGLDRTVMEKQRPRVDAIPFDSQHQYMATLHSLAGPDGGHEEQVVYIKGAVEVLLPKCSDMFNTDGMAIALDAGHVHRVVEDMALQGMRVLAFARGSMPAGASALTHEDIESGLTFLGLQALIDPPREETIPAIRSCKNAGIQVKMITGDHALTAAAIAVQIELAELCPDGRPPQDCALTGGALAGYSDAQLVEAAGSAAVFARVSPEQKLRLVQALQASGGVVAMTGDGVNDGPALKQADIGISMGITGTEVAREAADMVLTDDNFATIEAAVEEGRGVFDNLTKIIVWALPTNIGEGLILLLAVLLGIALPILPVHVLWINTITAGVLGLVLAMELKEPGIMTRPPRAPNAPILTRELVWRIVLVGVLILAGAFGLYELCLTQSQDAAQARTVAVNAIVMIEVFYLFSCRSIKQTMFRVGVFSNRWVVIGVVGMVLLQLLFTYAPFMNRLFLTAPLRFAQWWGVLGVSVATYAVVELEKWLRRRSA